jgi:hypothetical protein
MNLRNQIALTGVRNQVRKQTEEQRWRENQVLLHQEPLAHELSWTSAVF